MEIDSNMEVDEITAFSPYLTAIQSLPGHTPGAKYRSLNNIVNHSIKTYQETGNFDRDFKLWELPEALLPLARILVGKKLKLVEEIVEALKSSDVMIVKKALQAKWFFQGSNDFINAQYFLTNIFDCVSLQARAWITKALSYGLLDSKEKAESFFNTFFDLYGLKQALPFLLGCKETFIFKAILKYKITLSNKALEILFQKAPKLVIRYLYLGINEHNCYQAKHKINLVIYQKFLPKLIARYPDDFFKLTKSAKLHYQFGHARIQSLRKSHLNDFLNNPQLICDQITLKALYNNFSRKEFEVMYLNLFPDKSENFNFYNMLCYLKYYPIKKRLSFIVQSYEKKYSSNLLTHLSPLFIKNNLQNIYNLLTEEQFESLYISSFKFENKFKIDKMLSYLEYYPKEKRLDFFMKVYGLTYNKNLLDLHYAFFKSERLLELLPKSTRAEIAAKLMNLCKKNSSEYFKWCCYLLPEQSFLIFIKAIKSSNANEKINLLKKMFYSCKIDDDRKHLSNVLKYYNSQHKNEEAFVSLKVLEYFVFTFPIKELDDTCWSTFYEILLRTHFKNQLSVAPERLIEIILKGSLHRLLSQCRNEAIPHHIIVALDSITDIYIEYDIKKPPRPFSIETYFQNQPWPDHINFIKVVLHRISKYPDEHEIWEECERKKILAEQIINRLHVYNNFLKNSIDKDTSRERPAKIENFPWLSRYLTAELTSNENRNHSLDLKIEQLDPEFHQLVTSNRSLRESDYVFEISQGKARRLLKTNSDKILSNWLNYLSASRALLRPSANNRRGARAARKFVQSLKWHQELPLLFVQRCSHEQMQPGSLAVLSLLLEGEVLAEQLAHMAPDEARAPGANWMHYVLRAREVPAALTTSWTPVPVAAFGLFAHGEYEGPLVRGSARDYGRRLDKTRALALARLLLRKSRVSQRQAVRLAFALLSVGELKLFLEEVWCREHRSAVGALLAQKVVICLVGFQNQEAWVLMDVFIGALRRDDELAIQVLIDSISLIQNSYASLYFEKLLDKVEELAGDEVANQGWKEKWITRILRRTGKTAKLWLTKETIMKVLQRYYFKAESVGISKALKVFAQSIFCRSEMYDYLRLRTVKNIRNIYNPSMRLY